MRTQTLRSLLIGATALTVTSAPVAFAQDRAVQCEELFVIVGEAGADVEDIREVRDAIRRNSDTECAAILTRVESAGGADAYVEREMATAGDTATSSESFSASDTVSRTIEIEQKALVEGEVLARIPEPEVAVDVPGAQVKVTETPAQVAVEQLPFTVVVRQEPANISVRMPSPVITIDQPAPTIFVEMPDPNVSIDRQQPKISVVMPEPTIRVTQGEPELSVDVEARLVDADTAIRSDTPPLRTRSERIGKDGRIVTADEDIGATASVGEAEVAILESEDEDSFTYSRAEPQIRFETSDPTVKLEFADEPQIEFRQIGKASVQYSDAVGGTRDADDGDRRRFTSEEARGMITAGTDGTEAPMKSAGLLAADLSGVDVYAQNDEYVGDIDRIVRARGKTYVIVEHGGFLGIGDTEVAIPVDRIALRGEDRAVLLGMTEEQFDRLPDVDFDGGGRVFRTDERLKINRLER